MKLHKLILLVPVIALAISVWAATPLLLTGCASSGSTTSVSTSTGTIAVPTTALNTAYTVANVLQQFNTGLQASLPTITQVATATHNTGDLGYVQDAAVASNLISSLVTAFTNTVKASAAAGATPAQTQAAVNAVLAPPAVAQTAANVVSTTPAAAPPSN